MYTGRSEVHDHWNSPKFVSLGINFQRDHNANIATARRIHENGIWILVCLAGSVVFVGFTLVLLGCLCDLFGMDVFLPVKLFVILALGASILCSFGYSSALLYWAVSLLLFVN